MTTTELVTTNAVLAKIDKGVALTEILSDLVPVRKEAGVTKAKVAKPVVLSDAARQAVATLPEKIDQAVCPTERRALTAEEIVSLLDERQMLDIVEKVIKDRKDAQKTIVFNHYDVSLEADLGPDGVADLPRDKDGFYVVASGVDAPGFAKGFVRQVRSASPVLTADALLAQVDGEDFTHDDYLSCTTAVRVIDEAKVMLHLRKKPAIVEAIRQATQPGSLTTAHALGKVD
jgi:hypothetical protein